MEYIKIFFFFIMPYNNLSLIFTNKKVNNKLSS